MLPNNPVPQVCNYGSSAVYKQLPSEEQIRNGVIPLDSLPAAWWNCMWFDTNRAVNCARYAAGALIDEINTVLTEAGVCVCDTCVNQLYTAIDIIRQHVGNASVAGAVKSSAVCGQVSIDQYGIMTANGVGNAAQLTTTSKVLVGAVNELKSTYDCCISDMKTCETSLDNGKAPNNHASTNTTYGLGTADKYGHLKISDAYTSVIAACANVAASQCALATVYTTFANAGYTTLGDIAGCALGMAAAGTATTAARSDHVHPMPTCVRCACGVRYSSTSSTFDIDVLLSQGLDGCYTPVGYSKSCKLTFNPSTGILTADTFKGGLCGRAESATNSTCFAGCTYAQAKANILTGCAADSAKLGNTAASCYALKTGCVACAGANGSGEAFGSAAIRTAGSACGNVPLINADAGLGTTDNNIVVTNACGELKASGTVLGTAAGCSCDTFAPKLHSSPATTYGAGTSTSYGHVKVCDSYTASGGCAAGSVAASSCAVYNAYTQARCLGNASNYYKFSCAATAEAAAADCNITIGQARSYRWCGCTTNVCSYDRRTYSKIGTCQKQNTCSGFTYIDTCVWQCCYSGTAGVTSCTNKRFCFCSDGLMYAEGAVFSHASYACGLTIIRNATSGAAAMCFKRQTTGLGSIAFCDTNVVGRYTADGATFCQFVDKGMVGTASTYACECFAPKSHATNATTYGGGTTTNYGHVKLSDAYTSSGGAASASVAASSLAVSCAYTCAVCIGNAKNYYLCHAQSDSVIPYANCYIKIGCVRKIDCSSCTGKVGYVDSCITTCFGSGICGTPVSGTAGLLGCFYTALTVGGDICYYTSCCSSTALLQCSNSYTYNFTANGIFNAYKVCTTHLCNCNDNCIAVNVKGTHIASFCCDGYIHANVCGNLNGTASCATNATCVGGKTDLELVPVGAIMAFYRSDTPSGWLELNGQTFNTTTYAALYAVLGTNVLPDMRNRTLMGYNDLATNGKLSCVGDIQAAQLPGTTGSFGYVSKYRGEYFPSNSALYRAWTENRSGWTGGGGEEFNVIGFDNTKGTSSKDHLGVNVHTACGEVRSANLRVRWCIKAR